MASTPSSASESASGIALTKEQLALARKLLRQIAVETRWTAHLVLRRTAQVRQAAADRVEEWPERRALRLTPNRPLILSIQQRYCCFSYTYTVYI